MLQFAKCWKKRYGLPKATTTESWYDVVALCGNYGECGRLVGSAEYHQALVISSLIRHSMFRLSLEQGPPGCLLLSLRRTRRVVAGDPPSLYKWFLQMSEWVLCVIAARAVCGTLVRSEAWYRLHVSRGLASVVWAHTRVHCCGPPAWRIELSMYH